MLQNLSNEIREALRRAEECRRLAKSAGNEPTMSDFLDMGKHWCSLARSYGFAERPLLQQSEDTAAVGAFRAPLAQSLVRFGDFNLVGQLRCAYAMINAKRRST
jgi:hypothetical protein